LKRQEQAVVDREIKNMLIDERDNQSQLEDSRLLSEDRQRLARLFKNRTINEMLSLAQMHGVDLRVGESDVDSESQDTKENVNH
jgi:hypothetical protein